MSRRESHQRFYDNKEKSPVIPSTSQSSSYQKSVIVAEERTCKNVICEDRKSRSLFQRHRSTGQATVAVTVRRPPPIRGPCFEVLNTGNCKAYIMGRCTYNHSAEAFDAHIKKLQENVNVFLARSSDINDAIPASSCVEKGYASLKITGDIEPEVCSPPEEPVMLPIVSVVKDASHVVSLSTEVDVNKASAEFDCGTVSISYSFVDITVVAEPTESIIVLVPALKQVVASIMLFGGWSKFMFSEGFPPGPPKKPPPWFLYIKILVSLGTSNLWLY